MSVGEVCNRAVVTAGCADSVRTVARRMERRRIGAVVIVEGERPVAMVTDRDIAVRCVAHGLDPDTTPVSAIMTRRLRSIDESASVEDALARMTRSGIHRLIVTRADGTLVGLLSMAELRFVAAAGGG